MTDKVHSLRGGRGGPAFVDTADTLDVRVDILDSHVCPYPENKPCR